MDGSNGTAAANGHTPNGSAPLASRDVPPVGGHRWLAHAGALAPPSAADETVDLGALVRTVARGWRGLVVGALAGLLLGGALLALVRPWYRGVASVLVRNAGDPAGSLLARFGIPGDVAGAAGGAIGGVFKSSLETEIQLLQSGELAGRLVDSLALQVRVEEPRGVPAAALVAPGPIGGSFRARVVDFAREADGAYRVTSGDATARLVPGTAGVVPAVGTLTLRPGALPERFRLRIVDRADAIRQLGDALAVEKLGGEVVTLRYSGPDSLTAAAVPNAAIAVYLDMRRTVDRGLNARRFEFMQAQADSAARQLAEAEEALRREQEASGVLDPELTGRSGLTAVQQVREQFVTLESERRAVRALVDAAAAGRVDARQLTAFPAFLRAPGINGILQQLTELETERTKLLATRTERDADVVALTEGIAALERNLLPLARTYAASLDRQTEELAREQRTIEDRLAQLPGQAESALRRQRDVRRLSQLVLGLQAQMIDVRLAALGEGGQVRQVDVALPPKRPLFPRAVWVLPAGLLLGLLGGVMWALGRGAWSSRVRAPIDAARATGGLPAVTLRGGDPLLLATGGARTLVVVGADAAADSRGVAAALAAQERLRGRRVALVDSSASPAGDARAVALREAVERAEEDHDVVVVAASALDDPATTAVLDPRAAQRAAALVAREGGTTRDALAAAAGTLAQVGVPTIGVVVVRDAAAPSARRAAP